MAANTLNFAMGHLVDTCRLEILDLQAILQEDLEKLENIERYNDEDPEKVELEAEIDSIRKGIETRENAINAVSSISVVHYNNIIF